LPAEVAGERIKLQVSPREQTGSRESRRLRREGLVPGVLYGTGKEPHAISVPERELRKALTGGGGMHTILDVVLDGGRPMPSILKDFQQDPLRGKLVHVDLLEVRLDQTITATVTVQLVGGEDAPGVREGGALSQVAREVTVEALPMEVPEHLEADVSALQIGESLRLSALEPPAGVTLLDDLEETVLATVTAPIREEEPEEEAVEGEAAEGPEGEAGAEEPAADAGETGESGTTEE
jgi:large subunit ribosomal protein L25